VNARPIVVAVGGDVLEQTKVFAAGLVAGLRDRSVVARCADDDREAYAGAALAPADVVVVYGTSALATRALRAQCDVSVWLEGELVAAQARHAQFRVRFDDGIWIVGRDGAVVGARDAERFITERVRAAAARLTEAVVA